MAKNIIGIEKGDILVAMGKAYIYANPNDAVLDKTADIAPTGLKFGVVTGITKKGNDGFSYTEMVTYYESNSTNKYDLSDTKYYVLQSTYAIEENPDYDYSLNKKKTIGSVTTGIGDGFTKFIDLISGVFGIVQANKAKKSGDTSTNSEGKDDTTSSSGSGTGDTAVQENWFQKNKFTVIIGSLVVGIIAITVFVTQKNKKKAATVQAPVAIV